jgi:cytosine deaminase
MQNPQPVALPQSDDFWLRNARIPRAFLDASGAAVSGADAEGCVRADVRVSKGRVSALVAPDRNVDPAVVAVDLQGRQLWPALVDMHTHIDKSQVIGRIGSLGASFAKAREAINADRARYWNPDDIRRRMDFSIRCAYVHGVTAMRSHIDSYEGQAEAGWAAFADMRAKWAGRVTLQATSSVPIDVYSGEYGRRLADLAAATEGGLLGGVLRRSTDHFSGYIDNIAELLDAQFVLAKDRGLRIDLHVDETLKASDTHLDEVARAVMRHGLEGRVVAGHCCSLSVLADERAGEVLDLCAKAGLGIVSLPPSNLYMHDRAAGRTPRLRGVTLAQEIIAAGIPFAIASDNVRDAFIPFGDYDMLELFRGAVGVYHLDQCLEEAAAMVGPAPAQMMGVAPLGSIAVGGAANLIILNARTINEVVCRPHDDRLVLNAGRLVTDPLPDFAELDQPGA